MHKLHICRRHISTSRVLCMSPGCPHCAGPLCNGRIAEDEDAARSGDRVSADLSDWAVHSTMHQCGIELPKLIYNSIVATSIARSAVPRARPALIVRCAATTERAGERARRPCHSKPLLWPPLTTLRCLRTCRHRERAAQRELCQVARRLPVP